MVEIVQGELPLLGIVWGALVQGDFSCSCVTIGFTFVLLDLLYVCSVDLVVAFMKSPLDTQRVYYQI